jgi:predicted kinase
MGRSTLTLIAGLPGVGKSTVAQLLAEKTGAVVINSDVVRRELFPERRDYSSKETQAVITETDRRVREFLGKGKNVILDALFTKERPRKIHESLAKELGANFQILLVVANEDVVKERMDIRGQQESVSEATFAYYLDRKKHFEPIEGDHTVIDNSQDLDTLEARIYGASENRQDYSRGY